MIFRILKVLGGLILTAVIIGAAVGFFDADNMADEDRSMFEAGH